MDAHRQQDTTKTTSTSEERFKIELIIPMVDSMDRVLKIHPQATSSVMDEEMEAVMDDMAMGRPAAGARYLDLLHASGSADHIVAVDRAGLVIKHFGQERFMACAASAKAVEVATAFVAMLKKGHLFNNEGFAIVAAARVLCRRPSSSSSSTHRVV